MTDLEPGAALRRRTRALLARLPLPAGALRAVAEAAGAPPLGAQLEEPDELLARAERVPGGVSRALALLATALPAEVEIEELRRAWSAWERGAARTGAAAAASRTSAALAAAWSALASPRAWRWRAARPRLDEASRLLAGPLAGDPEQRALAAWRDALEAAEAELPARRARAPGHRLASRLSRWPAAADLVYRAAAAGRALPRLWPLALALGALWALHRPTPAPRIEPAPGVPGLSAGRSDRDRGEAEPAIWSPPAAPGPAAAPEPSPEPPLAPTPVAREATQAPARDERAPAAELLVAPPADAPTPGAATPATDATAQVDARAGSTPLSAGSTRGGAGGGGARGGARGSGTIRHTALPDRAPMAFLGVDDLADADGRPAELWVAQTEVTEAQWQALMRLDLAILTGRPDRPAEHMTWCEALEYANRLSREEGLRPAYQIPRGCHQGAPARWDRRADGYRLPTEAEWEHMAGDRPAEGATRREVVFSGAADGAGLFGMSGNAAELVWAGDGVPVARHRSCASELIGSGLWPESDPLPCRQELPPGQRTLGVGLRLVRPAR